jgi:hypothetical protein
MIDYQDGSMPMAWAVHQFTEKDGSALCSGKIPLNATIAIGRLEYDDIMTTSKNATIQALSVKTINGMFINSCLARDLMLGRHFCDEMEKVMVLLGAVPYQMSYVGGEMCPVEFATGEFDNRFHNFTFTICVF